MLEQDISDIRENLRNGVGATRTNLPFRKVSSSDLPCDTGMADLRILKSSIPSTHLKRRHVDYALCHPASKPRVFIEVKGVG